MKVLVTRASVAMGDDVDAPHESTWEFPVDVAIGEVLARIMRDRYLATITGGRATWVVRASGGAALAVVAQQWKEPRLLAGGHADLAALVAADGVVGLHFDYLAQTDPEGVYDRLRESEEAAGA